MQATQSAHIVVNIWQKRSTVEKLYTKQNIINFCLIIQYMYIHHGKRVGNLYKNGSFLIYICKSLYLDQYLPSFQNYLVYNICIIDTLIKYKDGHLPSSCTTKLLVTRGGVLPRVLVRYGEPLNASLSSFIT